MSTPLAITMLALEVAHMVRDLGEWQPVGSLAQTLIDAARGHDALTADEVAQLRRWAHRWGRLRPELRAFYAEHAQAHEAASVALWHILEGRTHELLQGTIGQVHQLHREHTGSTAAWPLFPRVP